MINHYVLNFFWLVSFTIGTADENKKHVEPEPKISTKKIVEKVEEQTEELSEAAEPTVAKPKVPGNPTKKSSYRLTSITNREDNKIRTRIDDVDKLLNEVWSNFLLQNGKSE